MLTYIIQGVHKVSLGLRYFIIERKDAKFFRKKKTNINEIKLKFGENSSPKSKIKIKLLRFPIFKIPLTSEKYMRHSCIPKTALIHTRVWIVYLVEGHTTRKHA